MTRKHFTALAAIVARNYSDQLLTDIEEFCKSENPRFNKQRFEDKVEELRK